jgi:pimeloyl-ACP methyl ester carboxylesterase
VLAESAFEQTSSTGSTAQSRVNRSDFYVESDPGIQIFVREVRDRCNADDAKVPVLLVHGGGPGGLASFDLDVPGYSLAEDFAIAGHPVYIMNVRGWGSSTRPASFNQPPEGNPPSVTSREAVRDISAVVDWIRIRNEGDRVALVGWATGGHWAGMYSSQNNEKVSHLVMLNSLYGVDAAWELREAFEDPENPGEFDPNAGDRLATAEGLVAKWNEAIPVEDLSQWREEAVAEAYQRTALTNDPTSDTRTPPSMRIPGAFRLESYNLSRGQKYWEAADITVPTLVIRGERDYWSRPEDLKALEAELVNAPIVETVTIPDGTHHLFLDRPQHGRDRFIQEVLSFLSNDSNK